MNTKVRRISLLGLISLPAIAVMVAVAAFAFGMFSSDSSTEAAGANGPNMSLSVSGAGTSCDNATTPTKCSASAGSTFNVLVIVTADTANGYNAIAWDIDFGTIMFKGCGTVTEQFVGAGLNTCAPNNNPPNNEFAGGDLSPSFGATTSHFTGTAFTMQANCPPAPASAHTLTLVPSDPVGNPLGASLNDVMTGTIPQKYSLAINCTVAPTNTPQPTATNTPTPTDTPTQVPIPRMQKCNVADAVSTNCGTLQNIFLTRQGTKIPPSRCVDGTDGAVFVERIHIPIGGVDPKDPNLPREIGGFSFQLKYDPLKVCVDLEPGPGWSANPQQICTVEDSISAPTLQGIARINCVTLGKATVVDTDDPVNRILASIVVRPQPEAYSQIIANQDNGQAVQLNNEACKLTDLQGHAIEVFSCEDADVTLRFLEGDVEPDCQVNTLDTQSIAFRWGATKGNLLFNDRFNLEPTIPQDQDIDVNDLQFVYGRFGSTCTSQWPAQNPVNPKA